MDIATFIWKFVPFGTFSALAGAAFVFFRRHLLDIELYAASAESFCLAHDQDIDDPGPYYAQLKATVDISAAEGLGLEDVHFVIKDYERLCEASFLAPHAPERVQDFFGKRPEEKDVKTSNAKGPPQLVPDYGKEWKVSKDGVSKETQAYPGIQSRLTAKGAIRSDKPFTNRPAGGYEVFMILVLKRFLVVVPFNFASMRDGSFSTIAGSPMIHRRLGKRVNPIELIRDLGSVANESLCRVKLALLDFDFLPFLSLFKVISIKKVPLPAKACAK